MRWLKHPMSNAVYVALITAVYAAIFIVSSEFTTNYETLLSNSWWAYFIASKGIKFVGVGMIGIAIVIDILSALRRKKYDEYQVIVLEKVLLINGFFAAILFPFSLFALVFAPTYFVEITFGFILLQWVVIVIIEISYLIKNYKI